MSYAVQQQSRVDPALSITRRQVEILRQLAAGLRGREMSKALGIAIDTVYEQIEDLRHRLGARTNPELVRLAIFHGFLDPADTLCLPGFPEPT